MSTALSTLIESYKREVAVPGEFDLTFTNTSDDDILGSLADAFGEAQLEGFFGSSTIDLGTFTVTPDLSQAGASVIVLFGGIRTLRSQIRNLASKTKYEAAGAIYEVERASLVLTTELKTMEGRRDRLSELALRQARATGQGTTFMLDMYLAKSAGYGYLNSLGVGPGGFYGWELAGYGGV